MDRLRGLFRRLRTQIRRDTADRELSAELDFHLEMQIQSLLEQGHSYADARRLAMLSFGSVERFGEETREARGFEWLDEIRQHTRGALRMLRRQPALSLLIVTTLGFGIGLNTALFSALDTVLLRPPHYSDLEQVVKVELLSEDPELPSQPWSYERFRLVDDWAASVMHTAAYATIDVALTGQSEPEQVSVEVVSPRYLAVLGVEPFLGTTPAPGATHDVMLSHRLWRRLYGERTPLGATLTVNGNPVTVVGVLPPRFHGESATADMLLPLDGVAALTGDPSILQPYASFLIVLGRVQPGVNIPALDAHLAQLDSARIAAGEYPIAPFKGRVGVSRLIDTRIDPALRSALYVAAGAALIVLLIACMNVSSLLLARALQRRRELAVRTALGGSRARIGAQLLAESLMLSLLGGILAVAIALLSTRLLSAIRPVEATGIWSRYSNVLDFQAIRFDGMILGFNFAVALLCGIVITLLPALRTRQTDLFDTLRGGMGSVLHGRPLALRAGVVVAQIALAMMLLVGGGLLVRSLMQLHRTDVGFRAQQLITMQFKLPRTAYPDRAARTEFYRQLLERTQQTPGISSAALAATLPLRGIGDADLDATCARGEETSRTMVNYNAVSADFFRTLGIRVRAGRYPTPDDAAAVRPRVVINTALAQQLWPNTSPLGRTACMQFPHRGEFEVIGVVGDVQYGEIGAPAEPTVYLPAEAYAPREAFLAFRTAAPVAAIAARVRQHAREIDPQLPVAETYTMEQRVAQATSRTRFGALLLTAFAALATLLAAVGVYGVMAQTVTERTREIGIRMALGSARTRVLATFITRGLRLAAFGLIVGTPLALLAARTLSGQLYNVEPADPLTLAATIVLFALVSLAAVLMPALRAMRVDPLRSLREE